MTGVVPSPVVSEKALRLLEQRRVRLRRLGGLVPLAEVSGDSGIWTVWAASQGVRCDCQAGDDLDPVSCSHKVAAQIAWAES